MNSALWVIQGILAFVFLMAGLMKVAQPKAKIEKKMAFAEDFSSGMVKFIGSMEIIGAAGLILPLLFDTLTFLIAVSAAGLALVQLMAIFVHIRRKEVMMLVINMMLLALSVVVAYWWF